MIFLKKLLWVYVLFLSGMSFAFVNAQESLPAEETETGIDVPFSSQAPEGNWSEPWQNACEETSIIMIDSFYEGDTTLRKGEAKREILEILRTKETEFNFSKDESLQTIVEVINLANLGWEGTIIENPTIKMLQAELDEERPIIVPVYAPKLNNLLYIDGGPDYHVVVLIGYDEDTQEFIIHDPGTQSGADLRFSYDVFMDAIHDLDTKVYTDGRKAVLFTSPKFTFQVKQSVEKLAEQFSNGFDSGKLLLILAGVLILAAAGTLIMKTRSNGEK
jgi:hypothetical protein